MRFASLLLAFGLVAGVAATARAEVMLDGQVPFAFSVGKAQLPAGHYQVRDDNPGDDLLLIRNVDTGKTTIVQFEAKIESPGDTQSSFLFDEIGGREVLCQIHVAGENGYQLPGEPKREHKHKDVSMKSGH